MMPRHEPIDDPHLLLLAPAALRGHRIELSRDHMVVGREPACDIRLDDLHVSRAHAALQRRGATVYVQDLGSSGGTFVNEVPATQRALRRGDVIRFASVQARFEGGNAAPPTAAWPAGADGARHPAPGQPAAAHYSIAHQQADAINNVGRDQYQAYFQQVVHERDGFLREVAAAKTRGRWLLRLGVLIFLAGSGMFVIPGLNFDKQVEGQISSGIAGPVSNPGGPLILGLPMQELGWAVAAVGLLVAAAGAAFHQAAVARRKRVDREHPLPQPWQPQPWQPQPWQPQP